MLLMRVIALVQLPPPVTGLASVNQEVIRAMQLRGLIFRFFNVGPPVSGHWPLKIFVRAYRYVKGITFLKSARRRGASILYMPTDSGLGLGFNIAAASVARLLGYDVWLHHHNFSFIDRYSVLMALLVRCAPIATTHIFLCGGMRERFEKRYSKGWSRNQARSMLLPNAFMVNAVASPSSARAALVMGHLANLSVEKGSVRFIEIFRELRGRGVGIEALMAGPITDREVALQVSRAEAEFPDSFSWVGAVYGKAKDEFFRNIDVFVFPTVYRNEAQPLVLLEALASGAVLLTTDLGCNGYDHESSPGHVFIPAEFTEGALKWLTLYSAGGSGRARLQQDALERFAAMRRDSKQALERVLAQLEQD